MKASIVLPTYNRAEALKITLASFSCQRCIDSEWEIIVVDDGSEDETEKIVKEYSAPCHLGYIKSKHKGRAAARNTGVSDAQGEIIIFCDDDRAVCNKFVHYHLQSHLTGRSKVVIGNIQEFFFSDLKTVSKSIIETLENNFGGVKNLARESVYAKTVSKIFNNNGITNFSMPWIAFLSGNTSLLKEKIKEVRMLDERFVHWGFEHFEFGLRLFNAGLEFVYQPRAINYHFAHRRSKGFYEKSIKNSYKYFLNKHPCLEVRLLIEFLFGEISLENYHNKVCESKGLLPVAFKDETFYNQLSLEMKYSSKI